MEFIKKQEQLRVDRVRKVIQQRKEILEQQAAKYKDQIVDIRKNFWDDVTVNVDNPDDILETHSSILQQALLLQERERGFEHQQRHLNNLARLEDSPYFGRIDFVETGTDHVESIYIGTSSLLDEQEEHFLVYDWRAPISSMYYDYGPGAAQYETPSGMIQGEMQLKRQYIIHDGKIEALFDTNLTIGDELLQQVLGRSSDTQLKNIVATIQKEQNRIIRNDKKRYLIVQGPAGSGKTSAALQRVAYLLYKYRNTLRADQILLFSPNPMFNSYVSTVLPDLGEENMQQTTFQEYLHHRLSRDFDVEDPLEQMESLLSEEASESLKIRRKGIAFKSSTQYLELIHEYGKRLETRGMKFKNLTFQGRVLVSSAQIEQQFYQTDPGFKLYDRVQETARWLLEQLDSIEKKEWKANWVQEEIQYLSIDDYQKVQNLIRKKAKKRNISFDDAALENKYLSKLVVKRHFRSLRKLVENLRFLDVPAVYRGLFAENLDAVLTDQTTSTSEGAKFFPPQWDQICKQTIHYIDERKLPYEDATPYLYLKEMLEGVRTNTAVKHVILDEGQDYTPFQFEFLKKLFPRAKMTILGDLNQAIFTSGAFYRTNELENLFGAEETEVIEFHRSYRSTYPIVMFTRSMLENGDQIEPFHRDGPVPVVTKLPHREALVEHTIKRIKSWQEEGLTTIAVICKTEQAARTLWEQVHHRDSSLKAQFISKHTMSFEKGVLFIPSYLAKGMEFDAVLIDNASADQYGLEERKLLYTSCTRAMHALHVQVVGQLSPLLQEADASTYELKEWNRDVAKT